MMMLRGTLLILIATISVACHHEPTAPDASAVADAAATITLDRSAYSTVPRNVYGRTAPQYEFTVIARYANHTGATVYLPQCDVGAGPEFNVSYADATNASAYALIWICYGDAPPIVMANGAARVDTIHVAGPNGYYGSGAPIGVVEGRFRLVYKTQTCAETSSSCLAAGAVVQSVAFDVHQP